PELSFAELGKSVGLSASEAHGCVRRLIEARLIEPDSRRVIRRSLLRFLQHGVPFAFPASLRETTRGLPTAWGAPVLRDHFATGRANGVGPLLATFDKPAMSEAGAASQWGRSARYGSACEIGMIACVI